MVATSETCEWRFGQHTTAGVGNREEDDWCARGVYNGARDYAIRIHPARQTVRVKMATSVIESN